MAVTWTIAQLEYSNDSDKGVTIAHWRCSDSETVTTDGVDVDHHGSSYGTCGFTPDSTAEGYTAYDSISEADVISWVQASVDKDAIEASVQAQIDESKAPASLSGVPW
tara:strand:+ start:130 stop:453 length:324 start_codon:yes stop_codon:yes gene_type:complete